ncbi:MAG: phosphodiester glycosidase family protein [Pseudomonadota bacterium]
MTCLRWILACGLLMMPAAAMSCETVNYAQAKYTICKVDAAQEDIRLFLNDPEDGTTLGTFGKVDRLLGQSGEKLILAMNAGMYHSDRSPVGHYVEDGQEQSPLITADGPGNFGLLPNGVFCVGDGIASVVESRRFDRERPACRFATQSGPMLVIDGALHPRFLEGSDSTFIRNGVGVSQDGKTVWFVISEEPVNFYAFGSLFLEYLRTPQALYFDGNISRLYVRAEGRHDAGFPMGPIVGVVTSDD